MALGSRLGKAFRAGQSSNGLLPHPALNDLLAFETDLRDKEAMAALASELCILIATRTGEVLKFQRAEFDLQKAIWTIAVTRMKTGYQHRIPLPTQQ